MQSKVPIDVCYEIQSSFTGDGDSSVMQQLRKCKPYGPNYHIQKIECTNHILRNYLRRLREIASKNTSEVGSVPTIVRSAISGRVLRLGRAVTGAINYRKTQMELPYHERVAELKKDIDNGPHHVFGCHSKCTERGYFCNASIEEENLVPLLQSFGIWKEIQAAKNLVAHHSSSLIHNVSTNMVESYNSKLCKFVGGKRVNFALRGGYQARSELAVISHNTDEKAHSSVIHHITGESPGMYTKKHESRRKQSAEKRRLRRSSQRGPLKRKKLVFSGPDENYGNIQEQVPDMDENVFEKKKAEFLRNLKLNEEQRRDLQNATVSQRHSHVWNNERSKRLTASNFGKICRMRESTPCAKTVSNLLYNSFKGSNSTRYGIEKEPFAIAAIEERIGKMVTPCGLFIDEEFPWLGASPDGLLDDDGIVEVKCPAVAAKLTPEEAVLQKKVTFCTISDGQMRLKETHPYMYQVQGQLRITKREYCLFALWTPHGIFIEKVERKDNFWKAKMEEKLNTFYMKCVLPELIDPRVPRNMVIREPSFCITPNTN